MRLQNSLDSANQVLMAERGSELLKHLEQIAVGGACPTFAVSLCENLEESVWSSPVVNAIDLGFTATDSTPFDVASITKLFTAAIVLRLHEAGLIDIFAPVRNVLPQFDASTLTIVDLLVHRANFGVRLSELRHLGYEGFEKELWNRPPPLHASTRVLYENLTYLHLGKLIEEVTGLSLQANFQLLFKTFDLRDTYVCDIAVSLPSPPTETTGTGIIQGVTHDESARLLGGLAGNAGVFATATDLCRFATYWFSGRIVSLPFLRMHVLRDYDPSGVAPQAIGWWMRVPGIDFARADVFSHTGFTGCIVAYCATTRRTAALTCNRTFYGRENKLHYDMWRLLLQYLVS